MPTTALGDAEIHDLVGFNQPVSVGVEHGDGTKVQRVGIEHKGGLRVQRFLCMHRETFA